jgi:septal ring factor EnvC (AmiA/AmiB activator)
MMNRKLYWLAIGSACATLGLSMPSCPGQQAMQQQVDAAQAKSAELERRVQQMDAQVKALGKDMVDVKTLLAEVSKNVLAQADTIKQMDEAMKARAAAPAPKGKKKGR